MPTRETLLFERKVSCIEQVRGFNCIWQENTLAIWVHIVGLWPRESCVLVVSCTKTNKFNNFRSGNCSTGTGRMAVLRGQRRRKSLGTAWGHPFPDSLWKGLWTNLAGIYLHTHENNPFSRIFLSDSMFDAWTMVHVDGGGDLDVVYFPYGKAWLAGTEAGFAFLLACFFSFGFVWPFIPAHWPYQLIDQGFLIRVSCHFTYKLQFSWWWRQQRIKKANITFVTSTKPIMAFSWWTPGPRSAQVILWFIGFLGPSDTDWVWAKKQNRQAESLTSCRINSRKNLLSEGHWWHIWENRFAASRTTGEFFLDINNPKVGKKSWQTHPVHQKTTMRSHPSHLDELKATYFGVSMSTSERKHESEGFYWLTLTYFLQYAEELDHLPTSSNTTFVIIFYKS